MKKSGTVKSKPWDSGWRLAEVIRLKFNAPTLTKEQSKLLAKLIQYST